MAPRNHLRILLISTVCLAFLFAPQVLFSQEDLDQQLATSLLSLINRIRVQSRVLPVTGDSRLTESPRLELLQGVAQPNTFNRTLEETRLRKRIASAVVPCTTVGEIRLVLPDLGSDDDFPDRATEALLVPSTLTTLLDPRFSMIGISVMRRDTNIYGVSILVSPLREMEIDKAEELFVAKLQKARSEQELPGIL